MNLILSYSHNVSIINQHYDVENKFHAELYGNEIFENTSYKRSSTMNDILNLGRNDFLLNNLEFQKACEKAEIAFTQTDCRSFVIIEGEIRKILMILYSNTSRHLKDLISQVINRL
jgi:hypothetical protein